MMQLVVSKRDKAWRLALALAMALAMALALTSCRVRGGLRPESGGRPYEVVLVDDADSIIYNILRKELPALPQKEPAFDVTCIRHEQLNATMRLARNIVVVDIDGKASRQTTVSYERNAYAEPQMVVRVCAPSVSQLRHDALRLGSVAKLLASNEMRTAAGLLAGKHNPRLEAEVKRMFGVDIAIPSDMKIAKRGKDFIWMSNDSPTAMANICLYTSVDRDSVMRANIKGETDEMFMTTAVGSVVGYDTRQNKGVARVERGLWEMHGDAMGGPFVRHILHNFHGHATFVAETFVYAPGLKKRNFLLATEASLYTIR